MLAEERRHLDDGLEDLARNQRVLQAEVAELVGAKLHGEGTASRCPAPAGQGAPAPTAPGASPTAEAPVASVEAQAHLERAHQIIASAVSRGVWVAEDRDQLRAQVNAMGPAEMESVLQEVGVLLNKGTLRKDRPGPIL